MSTQSWLLYLTLVFVATATPGPAVLFITTNSLRYGWQKTISAALGNILGLFLLGLIAITGLGALLMASAAFYSVVKFLGAAYLVYLGIKLLVKPNEADSPVDYRPARSEVSGGRLFWQAFVIAVTNPKAIVFLTALFPQFINTDTLIAQQFTLLIATLMFSSFGFLLLYAILASRAKRWLGNSCNCRRLNRASGSLFIGFGVLLAASANK